MKRFFFGFLIAGMSIPLQAMDVVNRDARLLEAIQRPNNYHEVEELLAEGKGQFGPDTLREALWHAALLFNVDLCRLLIENGADRDVLARQNKLYNPLLLQALERNKLEMVGFLIENGADLNKRYFGNGTTILMVAAAKKGGAPLVRVILATIPLSEKIKILAAKKAMVVAYMLAVRQGFPIPPADIRKIIAHWYKENLVREQVERQMERVKHMLTAKNMCEETAFEIAIIQNDPAIANFLNWNNPESLAWLRRELEVKIRTILFPVVPGILFPPEESIERVKE